MDLKVEAATADTTAATFSQVVFTNIPRSYPTATSITCNYTITPQFKPHSRDWVGIFKVGWSSTKEYHTFVWVETCLEGQETPTKQTIFKDYYLPKDDEFYQFCYIDNAGQVRGASTPFCFLNLGDQSLDNSPDDDLLVVTTQEQVEQSVREKAELIKELEEKKAENEALKTALQKEQKEENYKKAQDQSSLITEIDQLTKERDLLKIDLHKQQMEIENLKTENKPQRNFILDSADCAKQNEKYEQALKKIKVLLKERDELKKNYESQKSTVTEMKLKEKEFLRTQDEIQLLKVDLLHSKGAEQRLTTELQNLQSKCLKLEHENTEMKIKSQTQLPVQNGPNGDLKVQCEELVDEIQKVQRLLDAEKEESKTIRRQKEALEAEMPKFTQQLDDMTAYITDLERKNNKYEIQLREAHELIAEKDAMREAQEDVIKLDRREKEELVKENQALKNDIEELRRAFTEPQNIMESVLDPIRLDDRAEQSNITDTELSTTEQSVSPEHFYENIENTEDSDDECKVCSFCQERFPGITQDELELHEQSHRVCPFCTMICDNMEQRAFEDHVYAHEL